jgi:hypothetical protein
MTTTETLTGLKEVGETEAWDLREHLRLLMIKQPRTEDRAAYSDGFANGLAYAIQQIDAHPAPQSPPAPVVTDEMVKRGAEAFAKAFGSAMQYPPGEEETIGGIRRSVMRAALTAALGASNVKG